MTAERPAPLAGLRIVEVSMLGPGKLTTHLADLGADVIKVEPPQGDYSRQMTWPIVEGSLARCTCTSAGASAASCST